MTLNFDNSLVGIHCSLREEPVSFIADVEPMFYQVRVAEVQRDYLRFLWWPNGNLDGEIREYQMNVHIFGATS